MSGKINPLASTKDSLRIRNKKAKPKDYSRTEGIAVSEIEQRKTSSECLRYAWPADMKGTHQVKNCVWPIKLDTGTAQYSKNKNYPKPVAIETGSEAETSDYKGDSSDKE